MSDKKISVQPKTIKRVIAVTTLLFSISSALNMGYVGKALAFPFFYLFGIGAYFIYALIAFLSLGFIFKGKIIKVKFKYFIVSLIVFIFLSALISLIYSMISEYRLTVFESIEAENKLNFIEYLNGLIGTIGGSDGYFASGYINFFGEYYIGGGFLGSVVAALLSDLITPVGAVVITCVVIAATIFTLFLPLFFVKKGPKEEVNNVVVGEQIENYDVISNANKIFNTPEEANEAAHINEPKESPSSFSASPFASRHVISSDNLNVQAEPLFSKAKFHLGDDEPVSSVSTPTQEEPISPSISEPVYNEPVNDISPNYFNEPVEEPVAPVVEENNYFEEPINEEIPTPVVEENNYFNEPVEEEIPAPSIEEEPVEEHAPLSFNQFRNRNIEPEPEPVIEPEPVVVEPPKKKERVNWIPPSIDLLEEYDSGDTKELNIRVAEERKAIINQAFSDFRVKAHVANYIIGPSVTRFEIEYDATEKADNVRRYVDDISVRLNGVAITFNVRVLGSACSSFEMSNEKAITVPFKQIMTSLPSASECPFAIGFGLDVKGDLKWANFTKLPHLLLAGSTGSGKSVYINSIINTLIMRNSPDDCKLVLVDPKIVETKIYSDIPHLLCPIVSDAFEANELMKRLIDEMERRYKLLGDKYVKSLDEYNDLAEEEGFDKEPFIFVIIDEYANLIGNCKELNEGVSTLAAKARAAGIHLFLATQRPSTDVMTGTIKSNFANRIALLAASQTDSITMINEKGAESLIGNGDALIMSPLLSRNGNVRVQGAFISNKEIMRIVSYLKEHYKPDYDPRYDNLAKVEEEESSNPSFGGKLAADADEYETIKDWVMQYENMSMSKIQANCGVGFNKAQRIVIRLQEEGILSQEKISSNVGYKVLKRENRFYNGPDNDSSDYVS